LKATTATAAHIMAAPARIEVIQDPADIGKVGMRINWVAVTLAYM
jgi:hypothetical protein